jgi:hypothetical protein
MNTLGFFDGDAPVAGLSVSNGTLATIALILAILVLIFWLVGRWRP